MSKIRLREEAITLRNNGFTYGQIKERLGVSKSTLSGWLRNLPLTSFQLKLLEQNRFLVKELKIEKYRATRKRQRIEKLKIVLSQQQKALLPLNEKELFIAGLFLYWGEGGKQHGHVTISNSNPRIIKFCLYWMTNCLEIPQEKIKVSLHLYNDMQINDEVNYWSELLNLPICQFTKPYIKQTNRSDLTYKSYGHGTCRLYAGNVYLSEKIAMSLKAISDLYGEKTESFWYN